MKLYKLTNAKAETRYHMKWGQNITHFAAPGRPQLCTERVIHAYVDPYLAVLLNPIHARFANPRLWAAEGEIVVNDGTKVGVKSLTTRHELMIPVITIEQGIELAIRCALTLPQETKFAEWAESWLDGRDRTYEAAVHVHRFSRAKAQVTIVAANYATNSNSTFLPYRVAASVAIFPSTSLLAVIQSMFNTPVDEI